MPSFLLTRQYASAFNQTLSLNTSSVTNMSYMFYVRSARAYTPISRRSFLAAALSHALLPRGLHLAFFVCLSLDPAASVGA